MYLAVRLIAKTTKARKIEQSNDDTLPLDPDDSPGWHNSEDPDVMQYLKEVSKSKKLRKLIGIKAALLEDELMLRAAV